MKKSDTYLPPRPKTLTVSDARANLYEVVKEAGQGLINYEITQKSGQSVVLMSKEEYEGLLETMDILSNPEEAAAILESDRDEKTYTHEEVLKELDL